MRECYSLSMLSSKIPEKGYSAKKILIAIVLSILIYFFSNYFQLPLSQEAIIVLSILVFTAFLWVTEAIPLFLTSIIASILIVLFGIYDFKEAVKIFADPLLVLFFGGFLIARAMQGVELDKRIAFVISGKFRNDKHVLLALMFVTAFLSMWISNTASTIVMIPIALGIVHKFSGKLTNFAKASVLGIAYAANIGGVGTILGSPPNAIVVSKLLEISNITITFFDWMIAALPLVIILIPIAWLLLLKIFPFEEEDSTSVIQLGAWTRNQLVFLAVFIGTILLWLTPSIHGLSSSLVAIISAAFLFIIGLLKVPDLNKINYNILLLFGGGLVLGSAMFATGLSEYFSEQVGALLFGYPNVLVFGGVTVFSIGLGALASNTATAAILAPVIIPLAETLGVSVVTLAMLSGIAVSFDFLLPVGTPPNAIAYSTGKVSIREMLKAGLLLTVISIIVLTLFAAFVWG